MKIIGAFIIIGVCWMIGADYYKSNMKKLAFIKGLFDGVEFLRSEIVYSCEFLGESLLKSAVFSGPDHSGSSRMQCEHGDSCR